MWRALRPRQLLFGESDHLGRAVRCRLCLLAKTLPQSLPMLLWLHD